MKTAALVVDIGNTSVRLALCESGKITRRFDGIGAVAAKSFVAQLKVLRTRAAIHGIGIASVATPEMTQLWVALCQKVFPDTPVRILAGNMKKLPLKFAPGFTMKKRIGADRLANAMAAIALYRDPCVIADFGTALTVDGVNDKREFVGGMILPGMTTFLNALHTRTARLPALGVPPKPFTKPFGQNTRDAILAGLEHGYRGLVRETVRQLQDALGGNPRLIATGGMARRIAPASGLNFDINADLTLLGIAQLFNPQGTP